MKSVKMFGKSIPILAILLIAMLTIGGVSAAVVTYLSNSITMPVSVKSPIVLTGEVTYLPPSQGVLKADDGGTAAWATTPTNIGAHSVELATGSTVSDGYGRVNVQITPIPFQNLAFDPSYMVYETAVTPDVTYGGSCDVSTDEERSIPVPWGHPYINILLDLDGDLDTDDTNWLEGVGSSAGGAITGTGSTVGVPPTANTWTEMCEAWGYYDTEDDISPGFSGFFHVRNLAAWQEELLYVYSDAMVIGIQVRFGNWPIAGLGPVYVDGVKVNGDTSDLEPVITTTGTFDGGGQFSAQLYGGSELSMNFKAKNLANTMIEGYLKITVTCENPIGMTGDEFAVTPFGDPPIIIGKSAIFTSPPVTFNPGNSLELPTLIQLSSIAAPDTYTFTVEVVPAL